MDLADLIDDARASGDPARLAQAAAALQRSGVNHAHRRRLQRLATEVRTHWQGLSRAPEIVVLSTMADPRTPAAAREANERQLAQGAKGEPRGFVLNDRIYIVAAALDTKKEALATIAHESIGHWGLRHFYGDRLNDLLDLVARRNWADIVRKGAAYGLDVNNPHHRREAAEELLAEIAGEDRDPSLNEQLEAVQRATLRELVPSMRNEPFTRAELLANFIAPVRERMRRGVPAPAGGPAMDARANDPERLEAELRAVSLGADPAALPQMSDEALRQTLVRLTRAAQPRPPIPAQRLSTLAALMANLGEPLPAGFDATLGVDAQQRERIEEAFEMLAERLQIRVADDGLVEVERITPAAANAIGRLPVAMYHHTSSALADSIASAGLIVGRQTNFFNSQAGVYLSTMSGGMPVDVYSKRAALVHGGEPMVMRVRRTLDQLTPDPDDADLAWAQGRQYITDHVPPRDLRPTEDQPSPAPDGPSAPTGPEAGSGMRPHAPPAAAVPADPEDATADVSDDAAAQQPVQPVFVSALRRAIEQLPARIGAMPATQWRQWITANAARLGVRRDELAWTGLTDYLRLRGNERLSRADLGQYLDTRQLTLNETVLRQPGDFATADEALRYLATRYGRTPAEIREDLAVNSDDEVLAFAKKVADDQADETKYRQYTLPGGSRYREVLITLAPAPRKDRFDVLNRAGDTILFKADSRDQALAWINDHQGLPAAQNAQVIERAQGQAAAPEFKSPHWDQPNVLVHLRVDDRVDADGKRVLCIHEIQSDWGQAGRQKGFHNGTLPEGMSVRAVSVPNTLFGLGGNSRPSQDKFAVFGANGEQLSKPFFTERAAIDVMLAYRVISGPFVTSTAAWVRLALKRAMMMAVEGNFDRVAIVGGDQVGEVFKLTKAVKSIGYTPLGDGHFKVYANNEDNETLIDEPRMSLERVRKLLGDEAADAMAQGMGRPAQGGGAGAPVDTGFRSLSGLDIRIGAEGLRSFYDEIVPQVAGDLLRQLGGDGLRPVVFGGESPKGRFIVYDQDSGETVFRSENPTEALEFSRVYEGDAGVRDLGEGVERPAFAGELTGFDVTDAMRQALRAGVPMFQRVWHGSPVAGIQQFDTAKVGTGEGAQTYGWGLYFASTREVAQWYRDKLSVEERYVDGDLLDANRPRHLLALALAENGGAAGATEFLNTLALPGGSATVREAAKAALRMLEAGDLPAVEMRRADGQVYEVEIPEDDEFLLWDRGLSEQPPAVAQALAPFMGPAAPLAWKVNSRGDYPMHSSADGRYSIAERAAGSSLYHVSDSGLSTTVGEFASARQARRAAQAHADTWVARMDGATFYRKLCRERGSPRAASEHLNALGIKGIKYLDGDSRAQGEGTHNYVVFDGADTAVITERPAASARFSPAEKALRHALAEQEAYNNDPPGWFTARLEAVASDLERLGIEVLPCGGGRPARFFNAEGDEVAIEALSGAGLALARRFVEIDNEWAAAESGRPPSFFPIEIQDALDAEADAGLQARFHRGTPEAEAEQPASEAALVRVADAPDTPGFKAWFSQSQAVDAQGHPLVLYHGTNQDITRFASERLGANTGAISATAFFFTDHPAEANEYAQMSARKQVSNAVEREANAERLLKAIARASRAGNFDEEERLTLELEASEQEAMSGEERGANILPVYLSIQNPLVVDMKHSGDLASVAKAIQQAHENGHDGLRLDNVYEPVNPRPTGFSTTQWVVFKPEQIKSATGNNGQFDAQNPDIRFDRSAAIGRPAKESVTTQTESPAFTAWFKRSQIVNEDGTPRVVYRGESQGERFSRFDSRMTGERAFFFTTDADVARDYARGREPRPFFLSAQKVLDLTRDTPEAREFVATWAQAWQGDGWIDRTTGEPIDPWDAVASGQLFDFEGDWSGERWKDLQASIAHAGYDGALLPDSHQRSPMTSVIVFRPEQIKSASENNGQFDAQSPDIRFERAWHGSGVRGIRRFDTAKIGTGEGSQAFGYGLYFAQMREVAEHYRKQVAAASIEVTIGGKSFADTPWLAGSGVEERWFMNWIAHAIADGRAVQGDDAAINVASRLMNRAASAGDVTKEAALRRLIDEIKAGTVVATRVQGETYEVDLPDAQLMLQWDLPWSQQPENVRTALAHLFTAEERHYFELSARVDAMRKLTGTRGDAYSALWDEQQRAEAAVCLALHDRFGSWSVPSGRAIYERLASTLGSPKAASTTLAALGIKGIRYLDAGSRSAGDGSFNFVIFSGDDVTIVEQQRQRDDQQREHAVSFRRTTEQEQQAQADAATAAAQEDAAFDRWFAGSTVVTETGAPRIMYHGSYRDVSSFDRRKSTDWRRESIDAIGSWFSDNPSEEGGAGMYANSAGGAIYPVLLAVRNPKRYASVEALVEDMHRAAGRDPATQYPRSVGSPEPLREQLIAQGHDGIELARTNNQATLDQVRDLQARIEQAKQAEYNVRRSDRAPLTAAREQLEGELSALRKRIGDGLSTEFDRQQVVIAFHPEQIKSAIGNNGQFDAQNPDIRFDRDERSNDVGNADQRAPRRALAAVKPMAQTERPSFKRWFGASKVVNTHGEPLMVFHGTANSFDTFDPARAGRNYPGRGGDKGMFFSSNPGTASVYAEQQAHASLNPNEPERARFGSGTANIMPVYLSIQQPVVSKTKGSPDKFFDANKDALYERARRAGADGIIVHGTGDIYQRSIFVAFEPTQIKSAIGNNGEYDGENPDIRFDREDAPATGPGVDSNSGTPRAPTSTLEGNGRPAEATPARQRVWHGTRHRGISRFDLGRVGSGQGAASYGWGLYFAEEREVAEFYRKSLTRTLVTSLTDEMDMLLLNEQPIVPRLDIEGDRRLCDLAHAGDQAGALTHARQRLARWTQLSTDAGYAHRAYAADKAVAWAELVERLARGETLASRATGQLYEVEIPTAERFADWDRDMDGQTELARQAITRVIHRLVSEGADLCAGSRDLRRAIEPYDRQDLLEEMAQRYGWTIDGDRLLRKNGEPIDEAAIAMQLELRQGQHNYRNVGAIYRDLASVIGSDHLASMALAECGLAGIRYLDGQSRSSGAGTANYVVFRDEDTRVARAHFDRSTRVTHHAAAAGTGKTQRQRVFHGSPYRGIERFDAEKIGSGEGAADYGWGFYLASERSVAQAYTGNDGIGGASVPWFFSIRGVPCGIGSAEQKAADLVNSLGVAKARRFAANMLKSARTGEDWTLAKGVTWYEGVHATTLDIASKAQVSRLPGQLYEVEIPADDQFLHWELPLAQQPDAVKTALAQLGARIPGLWRTDALGEHAHDSIATRIAQSLRGEDDLTGKTLYRLMGRALGTTAEQVSAMLHEVGLAGVRYEGGRATGMSRVTPCYVVFSADDATILAPGSKAQANGPTDREREDRDREERDREREREREREDRDREERDRDREREREREREDRDREERRSSFDGWFQGSAVVNPDGSPMVVYHGTHADFTAFAHNERGIFFAADPEAAAPYSRIRTGAPLILPVLLSIKRPWTMIRYGADVPYSAMVDQSVTALKAQGYDGIHCPDDGVWIAFEPTQIKSAIGNNGQYDGQNPDIRFDRQALDQGGQNTMAEAALRALNLNILSQSDIDAYNEHRFDNGAMNPEIRAEALEWVSSSGMMFRDFYVQDPAGESAGLRRRAWYYPDGTSTSDGRPVLVLEDETGREIFASDVSPGRSGMTSSEAFQSWFGDSKVVDSQGQPLVVYHGTASDFSIFKPSRSGEFGPGIYCTSSPTEASAYTGTNASRGNAGLNVMPVYLSIKRPFVVVADPREFWDAFPGASDDESIAAARAAGHDGVIFERPVQVWQDGRIIDTGERQRHYVVFDPAQVKSALGNNGQFDGQNPDIRFDRAGWDAPAIAATTKTVEQTTGAHQPDLFGGLADIDSTVSRVRVISSKGDTTIEQLRNVDSAGRAITGTQQGLEAFWDWYDESALRDEDGRPLLLYHGTGADVRRFETMRETMNVGLFDMPYPARRAGIFLTANLDYAHWIAETKPGANLMPVYARMANPADFRGGLSWEVEQALEAQGFNTRVLARLQYDWEMFDEEFGGPELVAALKRAGYDGVIFTDLDDEHRTSTSYVVFEPEQVKSALGNRGTFSEREAEIHFDRAPVAGAAGAAAVDAQAPAAAPAYRSALRAALEAGPTRASAGQWRGYIAGLLTRGVTSEEIEWSGLLAWLDRQGASRRLDRAAVLARHSSHGVAINEVVKVERDLVEALRERLLYLGWSVVDTAEGEDGRAPLDGVFFRDSDRGDGPLYRYEDLPEAVQSLITDLIDQARTTARYAEIRPEGGSRYREILMCLAPPQRLPHHLVGRGAEQRHVIIVDGEQREFESPSAAMACLRQESPKTSRFQSSHWAEGEVLAHLRVDDRMDDQGRRTLFVSELQSDWGQLGRRHGFDVPRGIAQRIPSAPYVTRTASWVGLGVRRVLHLAATEGHERVVFTSGLQAAMTNRLAEQVSQIEAERAAPHPTTGEARYLVLAMNRQGATVLDRLCTVSEIKRELGGSACSRIQAEADRGGRITLRDLDITVGAEPLQAFYDRILPGVLRDEVRKIMRQAGGHTLTAQELSTWFTGGVTVDRATGAISLTMSPALREQILRAVPLFERALAEAQPDTQSAGDVPAEVRRALRLWDDLEPMDRQWLQAVADVAANEDSRDEHTLPNRMRA